MLSGHYPDRGDWKEELLMRIRSFAGITTGLAGAIIMLAGCVVVEEGPGYRPAPSRPGPVACTREYAPVCGERRGERQTFANSCLARADGFRIASQGACRAGSNAGSGNWGNRPNTNRPGQNRPDANRPGQNRPDASRPGQNRPGQDRPSQSRPGDRQDSRACTREYAPVCATRGRDSRTFSNSCEARSANYRVVSSGRC